MVAIAALIPAYNCADRVGRIVCGIRKYVPDVLVVDDGSSDETAATARSAGARLVVHERNRGKGAAVRTPDGYQVEMAIRTFGRSGFRIAGHNNSRRWSFYSTLKPSGYELN
jgi:hypothetical protein